VISDRIAHGLKVVDHYRRIDRHIRLHIVTDLSAFSENEIQERLTQTGFNISAWRMQRNIKRQTLDISCRIGWISAPEDFTLPHPLRALQQQPGILSFGWST